MLLPMNIYTGEGVQRTGYVVNFAMFNAIYFPQGILRAYCTECSGTGHISTTELQGDPPMTGWVTFSEPCNACIGGGACPNCASELEYSFDTSAIELSDALAVMPFAGFTCLCCGWTYDPNADDRNDDDYYEDEADYQSRYYPGIPYDDFLGSGAY